MNDWTLKSLITPVWTRTTADAAQPPNDHAEEADGEDAMTTKLHNLLLWHVTAILFTLAGSALTMAEAQTQPAVKQVYDATRQRCDVVATTGGRHQYDAEAGRNDGYDNVTHSCAGVVEAHVGTDRRNAARGARHAIPEGRAGHIFRDAPGHLPDTPANRSLLQGVADDAGTTLGTDTWGNTWSARTLDDGTQAWVQTRGGEIVNGGLNQVPRTFHPETGLSGPGGQ